MATRSNIGYKKDDGTYRYVYCHWDGYPTGNGQILLDHYQDPEKIIRLVEGGYISSLAAECDGAEGHNFDNVVQGQTVYYGRDRNEDNVDPQTTTDRNEIYQNEYAYLYENGMWYCIGHLSDEWIPIEKAIILEKNC